MEINNAGLDERLVQTITYLNRPWKIVLAFDLVMMVLSAIVMLFAGGISLPSLAIILAFSTVFSYLVSRILIAYHRVSREYLLELERVNHELSGINADLESFSFTVAHDLKSPITSIFGYTHILKQHSAAGANDTQAMAIEQIEVSAEKMVEIIDEILLLSSISKGDFQPKPIRMADVVARSLERLEPWISETSAEIQLPAAWPPAFGQDSWIEEVWVNYISNGLKYGGAPPHLVLGAEQNNGTARFWIEDNGPGIQSQDQQLVFEEFTRLAGEDTEGHGIGLAIVKRIIEKLNGEVGVESAPGKGSRFYFTLPTKI